MMGLLGDDWSDPRSLATMQLAAGLLTPGSFGQAAGRGLAWYQASLGAAEDRKTQQAYRQAQMLEIQAQIEARNRAAAQDAANRAFLARLPSPQEQALSEGGGPTLANAAKPVDPMQQMMYEAAKAGVLPLSNYVASLQKDNSPLAVPEGTTLLDRRTNQPIFANKKAPDLPSAVKEYQFAFPQDNYPGGFNKWLIDQKQAGAARTNVSLAPTIKMGESIGSQVGPMLKDSVVQTQGAVKMFDAADRIDKALASGKVDAGPGASATLTVKQFIQRVGGGNDEGIRQTRQVVKGLAQMSVEARKELQGQGQVTENEAAAVAKAESGDIDSLTTGELKDLVTLTKRASYYRAKSHKNLVDTMGANEGTKGLVPFYQVQGADRLLQTPPQLPQIGGGIKDQADAILRGK